MNKQQLKILTQFGKDDRYYNYIENLKMNMCNSINGSIDRFVEQIENEHGQNRKS